MGYSRGKYKYAVETAKEFNLDGTTEERDGKLFIKGTVATQEQANKIWDAIETILDWKTDIVADVKAVADPPLYTVEAGDTLSKIAQHLLGDANAYPKVFEANRDQLSDPDKVKPGQALKIPQRQRHDPPSARRRVAAETRTGRHPARDSSRHGCEDPSLATTAT